MEIQVGMLASECSVEVEIMATTSRASRKRVEDAEIFQVLEGKKRKEIRQQDLLLGE